MLPDLQSKPLNLRNHYPLPAAAGLLGLLFEPAQGPLGRAVRLCAWAGQLSTEAPRLELVPETEELD